MLIAEYGPEAEIPAVEEGQLPARYDRAEQAIRALHSYELPAIHAIPVERAHAPYADWVVANSTPHADLCGCPSLKHPTCAQQKYWRPSRQGRRDPFRARRCSA